MLDKLKIGDTITAGDFIVKEFKARGENYRLSKIKGGRNNKYKLSVQAEGTRYKILTRFSSEKLALAYIAKYFKIKTTSGNDEFEFLKLMKKHRDDIVNEMEEAMNKMGSRGMQKYGDTENIEAIFIILDKKHSDINKLIDNTTKSKAVQKYIEDMMEEASERLQFDF